MSANQDPANPDTFEVHVVKQGETLSGIAGEALKNSRLWPQLWEQNDHIINPHWIYPNDKILIRPVVAISEAKPPEAPPEPPAAAAPAPVRRAPPATAAVEAPKPPGNQIFLTPDRPVSEVKFDDLYCSGFVRTAPVSKELKVISKLDATGAVLSVEADYVYLSEGTEDGIAAGNLYQVVRPTKGLTNPFDLGKAQPYLGMHYLDVAQLKVVLTQPEFSLARVMHDCGDPVELGDIMFPFQQIPFPAPARPRPFSPTMTTTSGIKGIIVSTKEALLNFGSTFKLSGRMPGVHSGRLGDIERGIANERSIVYIDIGKDQAVKPGDIFIVYRYVDLDERLFSLPKEAHKLRSVRTAIGELIVIKVGERASTALVTYASDGLVLGDGVERR